MTRTVTILWPDVPPAELRGNARGHTRYKSSAVHKLREIGYEYGIIAIAEHGIESPIRRADVNISYQNPRLIDFDNLLKGLKPWLDGIVDSGLLEDDNPKVIRRLSIEGQTCKRGVEHTVVSIQEIEA